MIYNKANTTRDKANELLDSARLFRVPTSIVKTGYPVLVNISKSEAKRLIGFHWNSMKGFEITNHLPPIVEFLSGESK